MQIKNAKPIKVGHSFYFTIPKQFINTGIVVLDKLYNISFEESKKEARSLKNDAGRSQRVRR